MVMTAIPQWTDLSSRSFAGSFLAAAKDKTVRRRTRQLLEELIKFVQSLSEEVSGTIHSALINSANDKDAAVRVQVAIVLRKLAHGEDLAAIGEGVQSLTDILRNLVQFDPSPDVRRAALPDAAVRRTVFQVLKSTPVPARSLSLE